MFGYRCDGLAKAHGIHGVVTYTVLGQAKNMGNTIFAVPVR